MTCPSCSGPTHVIDSRADSKSVNVRLRRYECWSCAARFSTYEISDVEYRKVQAMRANTRKIDATIATLQVIKAQFGGRSGGSNGQD